MSSREGKGGGANNVNQACAACKHQRKKCSNCPLAPYFPPGHSQQFENVHKLFGVGNLLKTLKSTNKEMWPTVMETIQFQADARRVDPVHGCLSIVRQLKAQIEETSKELEKTNEELSAESMVGETPQIDIKPKNLAQPSATSRKVRKGKSNA
ncbi:hypothetical protein CKAN_00196700 [Cinnamomum micranthum f. kanehirae]|uniref:LOB domain-containing protein n=1 Tax=Cinnamomum micranthum f. kanehirae TaxID=337451 RepID=A0A3S3M5N7_9MAGN|nr:hypothetical protein CKAN_00196700 [Cinnamomum micranthum f. kanehirae]